MKRVILLLAIGYWLIAAPTQAAVFMVGSTQSEARVDEEATINVGVDTEGVRLNLFNVNLELPLGVEFAGFDNSNTIISVWVREPAFNENTRTISLIGGVPGGVLGRVVLTTIKIRPERSGAFSFAIGPDSEAYLNDGLGTKAEVKTEPWRLEVHGQRERSLVVLGLIIAAVVIIILWFIVRKRK